MCFMLSVPFTSAVCQAEYSDVDLNILFEISPFLQLNHSDCSAFHFLHLGNRFLVIRWFRDPCAVPGTSMQEQMSLGNFCLS